jgi:hypothetical protein
VKVVVCRNTTDALANHSAARASSLRESRFAWLCGLQPPIQMLRRTLVAVSCLTLRKGSMSTPLVTALRESCGYLRDGGYHQTAQLMTLAADEIERLNNQIRTLEAANQSAADLRRSPGGLRRIARATRPAAGR